MKLQITKGIFIGHKIEKDIPTLEGVMRSTMQMETKEQNVNNSELRLSRKESNVKLNEHLKSQYKDQKWLKLAFDAELNPLKLESTSGDFLTGHRIDNIDEGYLLGPINSKGRKLKVIDLRDLKNIAKNIPKVKL
jgi:hypothetical protein